jgi:hypothetical protein
VFSHYYIRYIFCCCVICICLHILVRQSNIVGSGNNPMSLAMYVGMLLRLESLSFLWSAFVLRLYTKENQNCKQITQQQKIYTFHLFIFLKTNNQWLKLYTDMYVTMYLIWLYIKIFSVFCVELCFFCVFVLCLVCPSLPMSGFSILDCCFGFL